MFDSNLILLVSIAEIVTLRLTPRRKKKVRRLDLVIQLCCRPQRISDFSSMILS